MTYEEFKEKVSDVILTESGNCPVMPVVQMLQGKWKLQILYELCIKSPMRFGELKKLLKPITNTALTNALKELEKDELVQRIQYNEMPLRVEYSLTEKGQDLGAALIKQHKIVFGKRRSFGYAVSPFCRSFIKDAGSIPTRS